MTDGRPQDVAVIIPVYNEEGIIDQTIHQVLAEFATVICVDDGSTDHSPELIRATDALLIEHPINLGQGAALQTGVEFALQDPAMNYFVTFDADGQHDVADAVSMLGTLKDGGYEIVIGSRFLGAAVNVPWSKWVLLKLAVRFTNSFGSVKFTDAHNGLRVFGRAFAEDLRIAMSGMAHASEIVAKIGREGWRYKEVPVTVTYTEYSQSKGQSSLNAINILFDMLLSRVKR